MRWRERVREEGRKIEERREGECESRERRRERERERERRRGDGDGEPAEKMQARLCQRYV